MGVLSVKQSMTQGLAAVLYARDAFSVDGCVRVRMTCLIYPLSG